MHGINNSVSLVDFLPPVAMATKFTYYPRGHGLFTNILSLLGNGRLLFRCQILAVNWGRIILSNNNNLLPHANSIYIEIIQKVPIFIGSPTYMMEPSYL